MLLVVESQADLEVCGEAVEGVERIEKAKALKPDLIILDLAMPRMNGVEAAFQLRIMMPKGPLSANPAEFRYLCRINAASSTGRCNTIQYVDSSMPPREK
jgi:CheY-like chemotaxis protein